MPQTFIVDVVGPGAFDRAKKRIVAQTDDVDPEQVTAVYAEITVEDAETEPESDASDRPPSGPSSEETAQEGAQRSSRTHYTEDDRELGECRPGSEHEALTIVARLSDRHGGDGVTSREVRDHVVDMSASTATVALGKLYTKRLLDREKRNSPDGGGAEYVYTITSNGRSELERIGDYDPDPRKAGDHADSVLVDG